MTRRDSARSSHSCQDSDAANLVLQRTMRKYLAKKGSSPLRIDIRWEHKPFVPPYPVLPRIDFPLQTISKEEVKKESVRMENQTKGNSEEIGKEAPQEAKKEGVKMNKEVANDGEEKKTNTVSSVSEKGSQTEEKPQEKKNDTTKEAPTTQPQGK